MSRLLRTAAQPSSKWFWFTVVGILNRTALTLEIDQAVLVGWPAAEKYLHRGQIRLQFMIEAIFLSALGGLAGTAVGTASAVLYAFAKGWPLVIPPVSLLEGLSGALIAGIAAGTYPAIRAARLTPTEALASA